MKHSYRTFPCRVFFSPAATEPICAWRFVFNGGSPGQEIGTRHRSSEVDMGLLPLLLGQVARKMKIHRSLLWLAQPIRSCNPARRPSWALAYVPLWGSQWDAPRSKTRGLWSVEEMQKLHEMGNSPSPFGESIHPYLKPTWSRGTAPVPRFLLGWFSHYNVVHPKQVGNTQIILKSCQTYIWNPSMMLDMEVSYNIGTH